MKKVVFFFVFLLAIGQLVSCMEECREARTITRPLFTADELKWINVADSMPRFRVSLLDTAGRVSKVLDTITGKYTKSLTKKHTLGASECDEIYYQEATNTLEIHYGGLNIYQVFTMNNSHSDTIFEAQTDIRSNKYFTSESILDTTLLFNNLYQNVYKLPSTIANSPNYYGKETGYIVLRAVNYYFELLPDEK